MKILITLLFLSSIIYSQTWEEQYTNDNNIFYWLDFVPYSDSIGLLPSKDGYLRTTDRGQTFNKVQLAEGRIHKIGNTLLILNNGIHKSYDAGITSFYVDTLTRDPSYILDSLHWWDTFGSLRRTNDGGKTWKIINYTEFSSVYFKDTLNGLAVSDSPLLFETSDGGITWRSKDISYDLNNTKFRIIGGNIFIVRFNFNIGLSGIFSLDSGNTWKEIKLPFHSLMMKDSIIINYSKNYKDILISTNSGQTWENKYFPATNCIPHFFDNHEIWISNEFLSTFTSNDFGSTWQKSPNSKLMFSLENIFFLDDKYGWAYGDGILKTEDGGITWESIIFELYRIKHLVFLNKDIGFAVFIGNHGKCFLFKSTDKGSTWHEELALNNYSKIYFLNENKGFIVGPSDYATTQDGGLTWDTTNTQKIYGNDIHFLQNGQGFIVAYNTGYITNDYGESWIERKALAGEDVCFIDSLVGLKAQSSGLFKTTDRGDNFYTIIDHIAPDYFRNIVFFNSQEGFAQFHYHNEVIKSTDGGESWKVIFDNIGDELFNTYFISMQKGWLVKHNGIYKYEDKSVSHINGQSNTPDKWLLEQNFPNPFNPITKISFRIKLKENVKLIVYDLLGNQIKTLVDEIKEPGNYEVLFNGTDLPSGIYFYKIKSSSFSEVKKMLLIK